MTRLEEAFDRLLIKSKNEISSRIEQISFDVGIQNTKARGYCYCLKIDSNGNPRLEDLIDFLDDRIVDYAIPKKEIDEALKYHNETGSTAKLNNLRKKATNLFTDLEKTGEGGEILLYVLIQEYLKLPQLISKMSLKTSGQLHYQGADGIHVKHESGTDNLSLYWGEAKMYKNLNDAISKCLESIKGYMLDSYSYKSTQERDLQLITKNIGDNINDPMLEDLLVRYFDKDDDLSNKVIYKGICFIGFDCEKYTSQNVINTTAEIKHKIETELNNWYDKVSKKIKSHQNLDIKEIHVFLMPFPSVEKFREYYLNTIK